MSNKLVDLTAMEVADRLQALMQSPGGGSLIEYTKSARLEPVTLVDSRAMHLPYLGDVLQSLSSIFAGYYLQAIAVTSNIGSINTLRLLDRLNPNRDPKGRLFDHMISMESYQYRLPRPADGLGLESQSEVTFGRDTAKMVQEANNLSVGKLFEVTISDGERKGTFPISLRLMVSAAEPNVILQTLAVGSGSVKSVKERFHAWRAGQLRFIRDLVLCQDLIDDHRRGLLTDTSGTYQRTIERRNKNRLAAILSGMPSLATASNLYVITEETAKELETRVGGRLRQFATREKIFKETYGMILAVVDPEWEQLTMYHRSIDAPTELSIKELRRVNRGTGPDVMEILKAFQMGQSPNI